MAEEQIKDQPKKKLVKCTTCKGNGRLECKYCHDVRLQNPGIPINCRYCTDGWFKCPTCNGRKKIVQ